MKKFLSIVLMILLVLFPVISVDAATIAETKDKRIKIHVFYAEWCSYCQALHEFLDELAEDETYGKMFEVVDYEYSDNAELMSEVNTYYGYSENYGIPVYIIGNKYFDGYIDSYNDRIKKAIKDAYESGKTFDTVEKLAEKLGVKSDKKSDEKNEDNFFNNQGINPIKDFIKDENSNKNEKNEVEIDSAKDDDKENETKVDLATDEDEESEDEDQDNIKIITIIGIGVAIVTLIMVIVIVVVSMHRK